ncbi:hypothetical protein M3Y97_00250600 [Aphelenchoides bicaudatus]|nr:hypothetical protein M3Y97_00250600 [Aphelenchoides bicaudatus]
MDEADAPLEKKRFEQFHDEFSNFNINSPLINEIEDDGVIDMEEPTTSDAIIEDEPEFYVEEPEEAGQLVLSNDLNEYLKRMKTDSIINRIIEVKEDTPDDQTEEPPRVETNSPTPSESPASQTEEFEQMEID